MLKEKIIKFIKSNGAIPFDIFMQMAALDDQQGYYINKNPLGRKSDFITAPEISQVFGELIGLWLLQSWLQMGKPKKIFLIELGAGRGTLLNDILRSTSIIPQFYESLQIEIIEVNNKLIQIQKQTLSKHTNIRWKSAVEELKIDAPIFIYSNEFFDALPLKQYLYKDSQLFELMIDAQKEELQPIFLKNDIVNLDLSLFKTGKKKEIIYETSSIANSIFNYLSTLIEKNSGLMLSIDYGYKIPPLVSTIRGFKDHKVLSIHEMINYPGLVDFTYDVNFAELLKTVNNTNLNIYEIITQREFLEQLGVQERVKSILNHISQDKEKKDFLEGIDILISNSEMGDRFKVMCVSYGIDSLEVFKRS